MKRFYTWDLTKWVEINPLDFEHGVYTLKVVDSERGLSDSGVPGREGIHKTRFPIVLQIVRRNG